MGDLRRNSDRTDPLCQLSQAIARGKAEVLQRLVQRSTSRNHGTIENRQRGSGYQDCNRIDVINRCLHCGKALPEDSHPTRKYCDQKCQTASRVALDSAARRAARAGRICPLCGGAVSDDKPANTIYCSARCQSRSHPPKLHQKLCANCGANFRTKHRHQATCSKSCGKALEWKSGSRNHLRARLTAARFDAMFC